MRSAARAGALVLIAVALLGADRVQSPAGVRPSGPPVDAILADADTTVTVETALMRDLRFRGRRLAVEALEGIVTLRGKVDSSESKAAAGEVARSIPGVKAIRNELQVVPPARRAEVDARDREIARALDGRLKRDPQLGTEQIDVRVDAGLVTLTGEVSDQNFSARAAVVARDVPGVRSVNNELACLSSSAVTPAQRPGPQPTRPRSGGMSHGG